MCIAVDAVVVVSMGTSGEGLFLFCLEANVCAASCKVTIIDEFLQSILVYFQFYSTASLRLLFFNEISRQLSAES